MDGLFARIYVDEDVSKVIVKLLRDKGFDAISASEIGNINLSDAQQLAAAVNMGRVIVTTNKRNFIIDSRARNIDHFGIIVVTSQYRIPSLNKLVNRIIDVYLNRYTADEFKNAVFYL